MRNWPGRLIYLLVVAGITGFAFYLYKKSEREKGEEERQALVFSSSKSFEVQNISIVYDKGSVYLSRQEEGWWMESPV